MFPRSGQPGFAMVLVSVVVAVAVILGMAYLSSASPQVRIAHDSPSPAESRLAHGLGILRHWPAQFEGAKRWTGALSFGDPQLQLHRERGAVCDGSLPLEERAPSA